MTGVLVPGVAVVALVGTGLMAGLFFTASVAVMPGLRRRPAPSAIAAMQAINSAILSPVFLTVFAGTAVACVLLGATVLVTGRSDRDRTRRRRRS